MNPRYQIFVSSTFRDLQAERQAVQEAILEMNHFPSGMEVFPAANATPWTLIQTIIKECDYYIVIIGGMYGSTDDNGVSYTEREYDFALQSGLPILAFLHGNPAAIPSGQSEISPPSRARLEAFRQKVEQHHHCKYWTTAEQLKSQVVIALTHEMRVSPRTGWIHADREENPETLRKLTAAMEANTQLEAQVKELREIIGRRTIDGNSLASGGDSVNVHFWKSDRTIGGVTTTWDILFLAIAPSLMNDFPEKQLMSVIGNFVNQELTKTGQTISREPAANKPTYKIWPTDEDFQRIIYQFIALDYIEPVTMLWQTGHGGNIHTERIPGFKLTRHGVLTLAAKRAIRRTQLTSKTAAATAEQ